jgi:ribosomal peptide maturation radical SAM protein 1
MLKVSDAGVDVRLADDGACDRAGEPCGDTGRRRQEEKNGEPSEAVRKFRVALVNMPFAVALRPSLQIGLLKAIGRRAGFPVDDYYFNLDLAVQLGFRFCSGLDNPFYGSGLKNHFFGTGDWLFSVAAFGEEKRSEDYLDYLAEVPERIDRLEQETGGTAARFKELRERVIPAFIEDCINRVDWGAYGAVGFTSTYEQTVASLALARRIKERWPHVVIMFGGASVRDEIGAEYMRSFPYVDYIVSGEGDDVFPELLTRLAEGRAMDDMRGVCSRRGDDVHFLGPAALVRDIDGLPTPDYGSFYEAVRRHGIETTLVQWERVAQGEGLPVQSSRGCWWGQKSHCTFCAFNGDTIQYRSMSSERFLAELDELNKRYGRTKFMACDSILNMKLVDGLFGPLGARQSPYEFGFFYTKAGLTREQLKILARGGMRSMAAGIESLNTRILKLMCKGTTRLQNINLLRWATYYGINAGYLLLHGFPGEKPEDYEEEKDTFRLIRHLPPPGKHQGLLLQRSSPFFNDAALFPTTQRRPMRFYSFIYPPHVNLEAAAFVFDYEPIAGVLPEEAHDEARTIIAQWQTDWDSRPQPSLTYRRMESDLLIVDTRFGAESPRSYALSGSDADVYEACSSAPRTLAQVCKMLASNNPRLNPDEESVEETCADLCEAGLMIGEAGKYLSLALPADPEQ